MESLADEDVVAEIRSQWRRLWRERFDDKVRAEGIACENYPLLSVDRGTVVLATRSFKLITLREVLEQHRVADAARYVPPSPSVGGWGKFIRTSIVKHGVRRNTRASLYEECAKHPQQLKKGGRGWLHV